MNVASMGDSPVRLVLLDLDGVLMDHREAARQGLHAWLGERSTPEVVDAWFVAQERDLAAWRAGTATWQEQRRRRLTDVLRLLGEPVGTPDELDRMFETGYLAGYRRSWRAYDDAAPALAALADLDVPLAVLTNGAETQQRDELAVIGLADAVGPVFTAEALGVSKPDPAAFLTVCERLGVEPATALHVGDEHETDVLGARGAGLQAVLLARDGTAPVDERAVVRSLLDLPPLLAR